MDKHAAEMERLRERFEAGDKGAWADVLMICLGQWPEQKPVPRWAREAIVFGIASVAAGYVGSYDDVFGRPWAGKKRVHGHQDFKDLYRVWHRCRSLHAAGRRIDDELFATVAKEFKMGQRRVKRLYGAGQRAGGRRSRLWSLKASDFLGP